MSVGERFLAGRWVHMKVLGYTSRILQEKNIYKQAEEQTRWDNFFKLSTDRDAEENKDKWPSNNFDGKIGREN